MVSTIVRTPHDQDQPPGRRPAHASLPIPVPCTASPSTPPFRAASSSPPDLVLSTATSATTPSPDQHQALASSHPALSALAYAGRPRSLVVSDQLRAGAADPSTAAATARVDYTSDNRYHATHRSGRDWFRQPLGSPLALDTAGHERGLDRRLDDGFCVGAAGSNHADTAHAHASYDHISAPSTAHVSRAAWGYFLDRGNGQVTRLVPADSLPVLAAVPATQPYAPGLGMMVLREPEGPVPSGMWDGRSRISFAQAPGVYVSSANSGLQTQIDHIIASSSSPAPASTTRPQKIWCDKWIHEGKCAFTQQGCKFRHEMPMDAETQERLGLFSGPPAWYLRKRAAEAKGRAALDASAAAAQDEWLQPQCFATHASQQPPLVHVAWPAKWRHCSSTDAYKPGPAAGVQAGTQAVARPRYADGEAWREALWGEHASPARAGNKYDVPAADRQPVRSPAECQWGPIGPPSRQ